MLRSILLLVLASTASGAQSSPAGSNWQRLQQLPVGTRVHVAADSRSRVCSIDAVGEEALTCSKSRIIGGAHYSFTRAEVRSVKLTRYAVSTLAGAGVGAGLGGIIGVATIRSGTFIDFSGEARAIVALGGGILGAAVAGPQTFFVGPRCTAGPDRGHAGIAIYRAATGRWPKT